MEKAMLNIGEFSKVTGLTVKAIHVYHEKGLLIPCVVDNKSGYRYFDHNNIEQARVIVHLKNMQFSLEEIARLFRNHDDEKDIVGFLESKQTEIEAQIKQLKSVTVSLHQVIKKEKEVIALLNQNTFDVEEKTQAPFLIAGLRWKGKYQDTGKYLVPLARSIGRYICGKPLNLYYELEFKEDNADMESCFPVSKIVESKVATFRQIDGGKFVTLVHKGTYDSLGRSYEKILSYIKDKGYQPILPIREIYLKGPGLIFKGNPMNYLTEIQIRVGD